MWTQEILCGHTKSDADIKMMLNIGYAVYEYGSSYYCGCSSGVVAATSVLWCVEYIAEIMVVCCSSPRNATPLAAAHRILGVKTSGFQNMFKSLLHRTMSSHTRLPYVRAAEPQRWKWGASEGFRPFCINKIGYVFSARG